MYISSYCLQNLEDRDRKQVHQRDSLSREQRYLKRRLEQLDYNVALCKRRSVSECSTSTISSTNSTTSTGSPSSLCESGKCCRLWLVVFGLCNKAQWGERIKRDGRGFILNGLSRFVGNFKLENRP